MKITSDHFEAFLKCTTKCWLRANGEPPSGNTYAEWVKTENESYRVAATERLLAQTPKEESALSPLAETLRAAKWRLAADVFVKTPDINLPGSRGHESRIPVSQPSTPDPQPIIESFLTVAATITETRLHAVERIPSEGRGKAAQFIPIRFIYRNKLTQDDKLLLAFDAFVLSEALGRVIAAGKIIHGDDATSPSNRSCARESAAGFQDMAAGQQVGTITAALSRAQLRPRVTKVKTSALVGEVRKRIEKIAALLSSPVPPDLVLNRHCGECEFQARCRKIAIEKDDLSLLAGMSEKERKELRGKGIFTITQLSYTFRPRRRPKRQRNKREKYHHSLKALAIREKKIHIVGSPELKIEGTPVYLDVEGLPDRDFYYLIGLRIGYGESAVQHSLWADTVEDEGKIWREFLGILETIEKPVLIHYGSYETVFLKQMAKRHGGPQAESVAAKAIASALNLVSVMFAKTYFPTFTNGLKDIANGLDFKWSELQASGSLSVMWHQTWNGSKDPALKSKLVTYNAEDCEALALVERSVSRLAGHIGQPDDIGKQGSGVVRTDELRNPLVSKWRKFSSPLSELEFVNNAAHWDYQRDRIYVRSSKRLKRVRRSARATPKHVWRVDKVIKEEPSTRCPRCQKKGIKHGTARSRTVQEVIFGRFSLKRRVIRYDYQPYWCANCKTTFGVDEKLLKRGKRAKYGRSLLAYFFYQVVELGIPMQIASQSLSRLFGLTLNSGTFAFLKAQMADSYNQTHEQILKGIVSGGLTHADETHASIQGKRAYVWVFTNMHQVVYLYSDNREGELAQATLREFKGVLVSDFYAVYDSFNCPQQKCLIHLVRDLNGAMLDNPYDEEMKHIVTSFSQLLKTIVEDVDRRGLKKHFLRKHTTAVGRFYRKVVMRDYESPGAMTCVERFKKNRDKLFTFLNYDGVPWNNNNAEHAIKAFARLREHLGGCSTENGLKEYLTLLSVCQTCKYMGVDFLDFLRSGEKDIHAFAESRRRRKRSFRSVQPARLPPDALPNAADGVTTAPENQPSSPS